MILAWSLGVVAALIGVYYLIPGLYHLAASPPEGVHVKHAIAFFVLAVALVVAGRFSRNKQSV